MKANPDESFNGPDIDASRRGKKGLQSSRHKKEGVYRREEGEEEAYLVTPDLSYN